jgi:hypothetical protein
MIPMMLIRVVAAPNARTPEAIKAALMSKKRLETPKKQT